MDYFTICDMIMEELTEMRNIRKRWWLVAAAALLLLFLDVTMYIQIKDYYPDFMKQEEASTPVTGQGLDANQQNGWRAFP